MSGTIVTHGAGVAAAVRYLSALSLLTLTASLRGQEVDRRQPAGADTERPGALLSRAQSAAPAERRPLVDRLVRDLARLGGPIVDDTTVTFLYAGPAKRVAVASDLNGWSPATDTMGLLDGTELFFLTRTIDRAARFEYKFVVDSVWMLDPFNPQQAMGGFGPNSELWMPGYVPPLEIIPRTDIARGTIDTLQFQSTVLGRTHPVFVYRPPGTPPAEGYPCLIVTDGGEYLALGLMQNVLDNLIADRTIEPLVGLFIDPRTDVTDSRTSTRLQDYAMSDTFVAFLVTEFMPAMRAAYPLTRDARKTGVMGASLGGLLATYAAFTHPGTFGFCAAQSPAYWWNDQAMIELVRRSERADISVYLDTGTLRDAAPQTRLMREVLKTKGYPCRYAEYPEGHNWVNWRARIDDILSTFLPPRP